MASTKDLNDDLSVGMTEIRATLEHYKLTDKGWKEYLLVRKPGCPGSYVILAHPEEASGFDKRLMEFHKAEAEKENGKPE
jgi:hypothetical protein